MDNQVNGQSNSEERVALGITSLVLGIISLVTMCFIIVSVISAIGAVIFGIFSMIREKNKVGAAGLTLGIISIVITLVLYIVLGVLGTDIFMVPEWYKL